MTKCIATAIKGGMPVVLDVKDASPHWCVQMRHTGATGEGSK